MESFNEMNLSGSLKQAIQELGYQTPSPIQALTLPILLEKETDFIGQAATGTGKTAAYGIPLTERIDADVRGVQGLILCPTRELAIQVSQQMDLLGKYKGTRSVPIYGGARYDRQIEGLRQNSAIVAGTPGRILDHLSRGTLVLKSLKTIVLDEADEMMSMGFKEDLEAILEKAPTQGINTWLFSATMSPDVRQVAAKYLHQPEHVALNRQEVLPSSVEQIYYATHEANKPEVLRKIIDMADEFYGLIFCQTKSLVAELTSYLKNHGYKVDCLHGDMNQQGRERTMASFRQRQTKILICTDVASRGLDVKDVTHVVNYSLPRELDVYVHRIGRTARSGQGGQAVSLVTPAYRGLLRRIEQVTNSRMTEGKIPGRKEIALKKVEQKLGEFVSQEWFSRAVESLGKPWKETLQDMSKEEIAGRFLAMIFGDLFSERQEVLQTPTLVFHEESPARRSGHKKYSGGGKQHYGGGRHHRQNGANRRRRR